MVDRIRLFVDVVYLLLELYDRFFCKNEAEQEAEYVRVLRVAKEEVPAEWIEEIEQEEAEEIYE